MPHSLRLQAPEHSSIQGASKPQMPQDSHLLSIPALLPFSSLFVLRVLLPLHFPLAKSSSPQDGATLLNVMVLGTDFFSEVVRVIVAVVLTEMQDELQRHVLGAW